MSNLIGDSRRIYCRFYNTATGAPVLTNPGAVIFEVKIGIAATVTYTYGVSVEVVRESTGVYYLALTFSTAGTYYIYARGSGGIIAVNQLALVVEDKLT